MELMQAIRERRAVREYTAESVGTAAINRLIHAAVQAPSAVNLQPWLFTVVRDSALLDRISAQSKEHMLALADTGAAPSGFREHLSNPDFHIFYHAPALIIISAATSDTWAKEDAALAAENLMLVAYAEGLGSCWIGFAQRWLETEPGRRAVDIPQDFHPVAPIIVGHPKNKPAKVPRNGPTTHWIG